MPIQEREPFAAPWQPPHPFPPRACHPLSSLLGFCGLSTAIFVLYRKKGKEEEQREGEEPREESMVWLPESMVGSRHRGCGFVRSFYFLQIPV